MIKGKP